MKCIQVSYKTKSGKEWLADINFIGQDIYKMDNPIWLTGQVYNILEKRYGEILDWSIEKFYN